MNKNKRLCTCKMDPNPDSNNDNEIEDVTLDRKFVSLNLNLNTAIGPAYSVFNYLPLTQNYEDGGVSYTKVSNSQLASLKLEMKYGVILRLTPPEGQIVRRLTIPYSFMMVVLDGEFRVRFYDGVSPILTLTENKGVILKEGDMVDLIATKPEPCYICFGRFISDNEEQVETGAASIADEHFDQFARIVQDLENHPRTSRLLCEGCVEMGNLVQSGNGSPIPGNVRESSGLVYDKSFRPFGKSTTCFYVMGGENKESANYQMALHMKFLADGDSQEFTSASKYRIVLKTGELRVETHKRKSPNLSAVVLPLDSPFVVVYPNLICRIKNICSTKESYCYLLVYKEKMLLQEVQDQMGSRTSCSSIIDHIPHQA